MLTYKRKWWSSFISGKGVYNPIICSRISWKWKIQTEQEFEELDVKKKKSQYAENYHGEEGQLGKAVKEKHKSLALEKDLEIEKEQRATACANNLWPFMYPSD